MSESNIKPHKKKSWKQVHKEKKDEHKKWKDDNTVKKLEKVKENESKVTKEVIEGNFSQKLQLIY